MHYFEGTKDAQNVYIDLALFKQIAFKAGMPLIVVDLMTYLCGGFHGSKESQASIKQTFKLLDDRKKAGGFAKLRQLKFGAQKNFPVEDRDIGEMGQSLAKLFNKKIS